MKSNWSRSIGFSLLAVLLLNVFHTFFLHQKTYLPITLEYTLDSDYDTAVWHTFTSGYDTTLRSKDTLYLQAGSSTAFKTKFDSAKGIRQVAIYWSRADRGTISIRDVTLSSGEKKWSFEAVDKLIAYSSVNVTSEVVKGGLKNSANDQGNGWMMLDDEVFQDIAKQKQFTPFHWITSCFLLVIFVVLGSVFQSRYSNYMRSLKVEGSVILKIRLYVLYLWMALLPFWPIASHIFLAVSLALMIVHFAEDRSGFETSALLRFVPLWVLLIAIFTLNVLHHPTEVTSDLADYSYFFFVPFLFLGFERRNFLQFVRGLEISVFVYVFVLVVAIVERYVALQFDYYFPTFFFEVVSQYWHTSYLAVLICVLLLFKAYRKGVSPFYICLVMLACLFMYLSQARLPLYLVIILTAFLMFTELPKRRKKTFRIVLLILAFGVTITFIKFPDYRQQAMDSVLVNDEQNKDVRPELWEAGWTIVKKAPYTGIGRSEIRDAISDALSETSGIKLRRYNAHNQYLEFLLAYGVLIPILFLVVLLFPIVMKHKATTVFIIFFSMAMLVESYLSRQAGVILFTFFYGLFMMYDFKDKRHTKAIG